MSGSLARGANRYQPLSNSPKSPSREPQNERERQRTPVKSLFGPDQQQQQMAAPADRPAWLNDLVSEFSQRTDASIAAAFTSLEDKLGKHIGVTNDLATRALEVGTAAQAELRSIREQKYSEYDLMQREKTLCMAGVSLGLSAEEEKRPHLRRKAAREKVEGILTTVISGEHWEVFDVETYQCTKGPNRGKHNVRFTVFKHEEAALIMQQKNALRQKGHPVWVWLTKEEAANKQIVRDSADFQAAVKAVMGKPKGAGYWVGWELDRAYVVLEGARTTLTAESVRLRQAAAASAAAAAAGGVGCSMQVDRA